MGQSAYPHAEVVGHMQNLETVTQCLAAFPTEHEPQAAAPLCLPDVSGPGREQELVRVIGHSLPGQLAA